MTTAWELYMNLFVPAYEEFVLAGKHQYREGILIARMFATRFNDTDFFIKNPNANSFEKVTASLLADAITKFETELKDIYLCIVKDNADDSRDIKKYVTGNRVLVAAKVIECALFDVSVSEN